MNIQLLKKLYSIYSPSGKEQKMVKFLCSYIKQLSGNISVSKVIPQRTGGLRIWEPMTRTECSSALNA